MIASRPRRLVFYNQDVRLRDGSAVALDVELLVPVVAGRLSPALPAGEQLLDANLYAVCERVAGRAARASSARQYRAIYTRFCGCWVTAGCATPSCAA